MEKQDLVWRYLVSNKQLFSTSFRGRTLYELIRYGIVGLTQNSIGYAVYLLLTLVLALEPKLVVAITYPLGVLISYFGNAKYTFKKKIKDHSMILKYLTSHFIGYVLNLYLLYLFVDKFGFPHQIIQLICVALISILLFLLFKFFVFTSQSKG
ncbi:GtrA family protein [Vibrio bivalvicida]|uniref:GtrA/DPMS transmembrane domain-containing protein n=1 Tax=Vibrio bivalvicida TaxID=1276888 RepID=A0A177Y5Q0_9VIBR|nr:hypothetical protein APB76_01345 [Vibrio bivalvicida]